MVQPLLTSKCIPYMLQYTTTLWYVTCWQTHIFRCNENGEAVFTETEVINHKTEIKTNSVKADISTNMHIHQSERHSRRKQRSRKRKQKVSRRRKSRRMSSELLLISENICNMTISREVSESGHCSAFGSFCNIFQTDTFRQSEVIINSYLSSRKIHTY